MRNLLFDNVEVEEVVVEDEFEQVGLIVVNYYYFNVLLFFIFGSGMFLFFQVYLVICQYICFEVIGVCDGIGQNGWYYFIFFVNIFWQFKFKMIIVNEIVIILFICIDFNNLVDWKFKFMVFIEMNSKE